MALKRNEFLFQILVLHFDYLVNNLPWIISSIRSCSRSFSLFFYRSMVVQFWLKTETFRDRAPLYYATFLYWPAWCRTQFQERKIGTTATITVTRQQGTKVQDFLEPKCTRHTPARNSDARIKSLACARVARFLHIKFIKIGKKKRAVCEAQFSVHFVLAHFKIPTSKLLTFDGNMIIQRSILNYIYLPLRCSSCQPIATWMRKE